MYTVGTLYNNYAVFDQDLDVTVHYTADGPVYAGHAVHRSKAWNPTLNGVVVMPCNYWVSTARVAAVRINSLRAVGMREDFNQ